MVKVLHECFLWLILPVCPLPSDPTAFGPTVGASPHDSLHVSLGLCVRLSPSPLVPWVTSGAPLKAPCSSLCFSFETQISLIHYHLASVATSTGRLRVPHPLGDRRNLNPWLPLLLPPHSLSLPTVPPVGCWQTPPPHPTALDRLVVSLDFFFSPPHIRFSKSSWFHL